MLGSGQGFNLLPEAKGGSYGGWIGKFFGGLADEKRSRRMAQLSVDVHGLKLGQTFDARQTTEGMLTGQIGERNKDMTANLNERSTHNVHMKAAGKAVEEKHTAKNEINHFKQMNRQLTYKGKAKYDKDGNETRSAADDPDIMHPDLAQMNTKGWTKQRTGARNRNNKIATVDELPGNSGGNS